MFCIHCGAKNGDSNRFCVKCGQLLEIPDQDGAPATGAFDPAAGADPAPEAPPAQPAAPEEPRPEEPWEAAPCRAAPVEPEDSVEPVEPVEPAQPAGDWTGGFADPPCAPEVPPCPDADPPASGVIVRNGAWTSTDLAEPPPPPAPPAAGRGRPWLVLSLCLAAALAGAGTLCFLLLRGGLVGAEEPAFSLFIPAALGGAALIFGVLALVLVLTGRAPAQDVVDASRVPPQAQPSGGVIPVTLTDTARPDQAVRIPLAVPVVIGRTEDSCDLALPYEKSVSKRHCRIFPSGGCVYLEDLGGRNGTYLNGAQVLVPTALHSGDLIKLGRLVLRIDIG